MSEQEQDACLGKAVRDRKSAQRLEASLADKLETMASSMRSASKTISDFLRSNSSEFLADIPDLPTREEVRTTIEAYIEARHNRSELVEKVARLGG